VDNIPWFLDRLKGVKRSGSGWEMRCPAHVDKNPSLNIDRGHKGWLLHCHRGCSFHEIMDALTLPYNAAFYDYDAPKNMLAMDTDIAFKEWVNNTPAWSLCVKAHTLEDVAWLTYPQEPHKLAQANAECHPYAGLHFEEAMSMWLTSGAAWLDWWLSERWMMAGGWHKIGWNDFARYMKEQMWQTYLKRGCSDLTCEGNPSPDPALTAEEYLARHTTPTTTPSGSSS